MAKADAATRVLSAATAARAALIADVTDAVRHRLRDQAEAVITDARLWFGRMPKRRWSLVDARQQGLIPVIAMTARRYAQAVADVMTQELVAARRRAYLRALTAAALAQRAIGQEPKLLAMRLTARRQESVRIRGRTVRIMETDAEDGHWVTINGQHVFIGKSGAAPQDKHPVDTPEFQQWFGKSKAVDASGRPLIVYHGSPVAGQITDLRPSGRQAWFGDGIYFTDSADQAGLYAMHGDSKYQTATPPSPAVLPVYLSLQDPFIADSEMADKALIDRVAAGIKQRGSGRMADQFVRWQRSERPDRATVWRFLSNSKWSGYQLSQAFAKDVIEQAGFDGIIGRPGADTEFDAIAHGASHYVAFHSTQVKSAIGNRGGFNRKNPSIIESHPSSRQRQPLAEPDWPHNGKRRVVRLIIRERNGDVVVCDYGHSLLVLPGGGVEDGESPQEAAVREALEEAGLLCEVTAWLCDQETDTESIRYYVGVVQSEQ